MSVSEILPPRYPMTEGPKGTMPLGFVREFHSCRGQKVMEHVDCDTCGLTFDVGMYAPSPPEPLAEPQKHPIRFLWDHAKQGHRARFVACFYWCWDTNDGTRWVGMKTYGFVWAPNPFNRMLGFQVDFIHEDIDIT